MQLILVFIVVTTVLLKDFGPMRKAENEQLEVAIDSTSEHSDLEPKGGVKLNIWNAIIPIGTLIQLFKDATLSFTAIREAFSASDASVALLQSALLSGLVTIVMAVTQKIFTVSEAIDVWVDGMKTLVITGVILILAWSLSSVIKELGTAKYLIKLLSGSFLAFLSPSIIFILGSIISFATGTYYGTMGILMLLAIPLAYSINPDMSYIVVSTSAVLTGAIFVGVQIFGKRVDNVEEALDIYK